MRTASRVFFLLGLFGFLASVGYAAASRFSFDNVGGTTTLAMFFLSCMFIAKLMGTQGSLELDGLNLPHDDDAHEAEEIHLPPPSWMPAAYGVALFVLVLGVVYHTGILVAGVVLTVLVTIGWGIESVREYRREIAHHTPPAHLPSAPAVELAQQVLAFRHLHGGADAVVQHVGRGRAQVVLVGNDGAYGMLHADDVAVAREAASLAATARHESWTPALAARLRTGEDAWRRMGGESLFGTEGAHDAPRDGATQVAAKVFLGLGLFALIADVLFVVGSRFSFDNAQGITALAAFALADFYLYVGLKNAKARPEDAAYAGEDHVTVEPEKPDPPVDLEHLHLPGPSWWPAFFSVALGVLVYGLVFSPGMLVAGVVALVVCCVGWGIESVHEYRQSISGQHHGAADALGKAH